VKCRCGDHEKRVGLIHIKGHRSPLPYQMNSGKKEQVMKKFGIMLAAVALFCDVPLSLEWSQADGPIPVLSLDSAQARIGRPATPGSVAGVARRTTRRAVRRTAIYCTSAYRPAGCVWR
jgi:hypothetical protein